MVAFALAKLNPVETVRQYSRAIWLSTPVLETYDHIIEAASEAWSARAAQPALIASVGTRDWALVGRKRGPLA